MIQQELTFAKEDFSVVEIGSEDARKRTECLQGLRDLVVQHETMYPNIQAWFDRKVVPGLVTGERGAFLGLINGHPVVSAIVKRGERSKICHLSVGGDLQDKHVGELFFILMALRVRSVAKEIHFTLPEGLWERRSDFFQSFGFSQRYSAGSQYRPFERELVCSAPFADVWYAALSKIHKVVSTFSTDGYSLDCSLVLSLKPRWASEIFSGRKTIEIRRVFSRRWEGHRASIYASHPVRGLIGEALIARVVEASPEVIWTRYGHATGSDRATFEAYAAGTTKLFAIELAEVRAFPTVIGLSDFSDLLGRRPHVPQSYAATPPTSLWGRCISLAAMLNGGTVPSMRTGAFAHLELRR